MKVYIGIPMFEGADAEFISSLMKTRLILDKLGYEVEVDMHTGCSVLPKARNEIVKRFMDSGFDVLFFIDSDMSWDAVDFVRLIKSGNDFSACVYRSKSEDINFHYVPKQGQFGCESSDGWLLADSVGTGFMCLWRSVIEHMIDNYPETKYKDENGVKFHALFDFEIHDGRYWGEDYTFCRRWCAIGGDIYVRVDATIKHLGKKSYIGNYAEHIKGKENVSVAI